MRSAVSRSQAKGTRERAALVPLTYKRVLALRRPWVEGVAVNPLGLTTLDRAIVSRPG